MDVCVMLHGLLLFTTVLAIKLQDGEVFGVRTGIHIKIMNVLGEALE